MTLEVLLTIVAIILGPILAVQAQKAIERVREKRGRKLWLFRELMATRGTRLSQRHVEALNTIELEYDPAKEKERKIHEAWRSYFDVLHTPIPSDGIGAQSLFQRRDDSLIELLYEMGNFLGYRFDRVALRRNSYTPQAHGDIELELNIIRKALAKIFTSKGHALPVQMVDQQYETPPIVTSADLGPITVPDPEQPRGVTVTSRGTP